MDFTGYQGKFLDPSLQNQNILQDVCWETFLGPGWSKGPPWEPQVLGGISYTLLRRRRPLCNSNYLRDITTELVQSHLDLTPQVVIFEARNSHCPGASLQCRMFSCWMRLHCHFVGTNRPTSLVSLIASRCDWRISKDFGRCLCH